MYLFIMNNLIIMNIIRSRPSANATKIYPTWGNATFVSIDNNGNIVKAKGNLKVAYNREELKISIGTMLFTKIRSHVFHT